MENTVPSQQQNRPVRVRFAPSPTGHLHIGSLRSALFNWCFARHTGGTFIIRIEDTDRERSTQEYVDSILHAFEWLHIKSDEPITYQTQRMDLYKQYIERLIDEDKAYWSDPRTEENGKSVIRFRIPRDRTEIAFDDVVLGRIAFPIDQFDDFVIARADGCPLYNFVVVVDDIAMQISHVIRGADHISNTPKQVLLYEAFGECPPLFGHIPLILGPDGSKLSKRDAATAVTDYRLQGFLPEALCNYLIRLGWSHGDQEIFTQEELFKVFSLEGINKSGAIFDVAKLRWVNEQYLKAATAEWLVDYIEQNIDSEFTRQCPLWSRLQLEGFVDLYKERVATVSALRDAVMSVHAGPAWQLPLPEELRSDANVVPVVDAFYTMLEPLTMITRDEVEQYMKAACAACGAKLPSLAKSVRYALAGTLSSPSIYDMIVLFGVDEVRTRLEKFRSKCNDV